MKSDIIDYKDISPSSFTSTRKSNTITPPDLAATISFSDPSANNALDAEETATLTIKISNSGKGSAGMVEAKLSCPAIMGFSFPGSVYFGEIKAGESSSKSIELKGTLELKDAEAELRVEFSEQNGFPPDAKIVKFSTKSLIPPDLVISEVGIDDFSKNGKIEPGEPVELRVRIYNRGNGVAKNLRAEILPGKDVFLMSGSEAVKNIGNLSAGDYEDLVFSILTAKTATDLNIKLNLNEARSQFSKLNQALALAFNRIEKTADAMIITARDSKHNLDIIAPALSIDIEQDIPIRAKPNNNRWAVIIGIENYRNVSKVRFALRDAEFIKEYFIKVLGIPAENIYMITDDEATQGAFNTVFNPKGWLANNAAGKDNEIFIYYSGHGAPDISSKKSYLLPSDGNPNYAAISGYDLDQLYANLQALQAKQITLFLDSCFSGANRDNEIILADARPVFISTSLPAAAPNLAVFSASKGSQISSAYGDKQHGLFSYFLMKGLRGEADANKDNKLSQAELQEYLSSQVNSTARRLGREQNPELQSGEHSKVIVAW